ncbi:MAG: hypothetical protein N2749_01575 [Clostridia bacterium]|nr:hypothetical protein [Clostridia bacterium]
MLNLNYEAEFGLFSKGFRVKELIENIKNTLLRVNSEKTKDDNQYVLRDASVYFNTNIYYYLLENKIEVVPHYCFEILTKKLESENIDARTYKRLYSVKCSIHDGMLHGKVVFESDPLAIKVTNRYIPEKLSIVSIAYKYKLMGKRIVVHTSNRDQSIYLEWLGIPCLYVEQAKQY